MKELLVETIKGLTYKPGWTFAVEDFLGLDGNRIITLNIKCDAICVDSGEKITIDRNFIWNEPKSDLGKFLAEMVPADFAMQSWIADCIDEIERHEVHEWLKFNGTRYHPETHRKDGY